MTEYVKTAYVGIDPGKNGGIACLGPTGAVLRCERMPSIPRDAWQILHSIATLHEDVFCYIEKVGAMPGQGVSSMFNFGYNAGMLEGMVVAAKIPYSFVPPGTWQKKLQCLTRGDKQITKRLAAQLFPLVKVTHKVADALLIAEYCRVTKGNHERATTLQAGD